MLPRLGKFDRFGLGHAVLSGTLDELLPDLGVDALDFPSPRPEPLSTLSRPCALPASVPPLCITSASKEQTGRAKNPAPIQPSVAPIFGKVLKDQSIRNRNAPTARPSRQLGPEAQP
jgi:hypothetical protein